MRTLLMWFLDWFLWGFWYDVVGLVSDSSGAQLLGLFVVLKVGERSLNP